MKLEIERDKMQAIYHVLTEIAYGNFAYRLKRTDTNDEFDALIVIINMTIENIKASFQHHGFINSRRAYAYLSNIQFMLNEEFCIEDMNDVALKIMNRDLRELQGMPFAQTLTEPSQKMWKHLKASLLQNTSRNPYQELTFNVDNHYVVPTLCNFSRLLRSKLICVTSVEVIQQDDMTEDIAENPGLKKVEITKENKKDMRGSIPKGSDIQLFQAIYDYISDLEKPMPTIKKLARAYGISEDKLKRGFKRFFNATIYQYYNERRLDKAILLIQHSEAPLSTIAKMAGFKTYSCFHRVFKLKYGCPPKEMKKVAWLS